MSILVTDISMCSLDTSSNTDADSSYCSDSSLPSLASSVSSASSDSSPTTSPVEKLDSFSNELPSFTKLNHARKSATDYVCDTRLKPSFKVGLGAAFPAQPLSLQRRHSASSTQSALAPKPAGVTKSLTLPVSSSEKRCAFVNSLVDSAALMIEAVWPSARDPPSVNISSPILPLRTFIEETLRRSRTSYSTLQVALYYLYILRPHVQDPKRLQGSMGALHCGRRAFLTSLILASKYLQDKNYSARAWSKISGLTTTEINTNEMAFLIAVDWKIHVPEDVYGRWSSVLLSSTHMVSRARSQSVTTVSSTKLSTRSTLLPEPSCVLPTSA
ncbi:hypothetical protein V1512DRAFT_257931 [Lipomyces arxii]|uniref:uncharacterized protein n=1 Tax=Lipomyces arxii TaxID=56418 RepID=UPI0034CDF39D